jgi:16S rRNA (guanine527-N7)-methyltransferase
VSAPTPLLAVLVRARQLGVLGPGPVEDHVVHAQAFVDALAALPGGSLVVDLGSGAGIPGLVVALARSDLRLVLVDAAERRTALLEEAVAALGVQEQVQVVRGRAEVLGHQDLWRQQAAAVTARSFGPPAVTAECAAPLLAVGGLLVVSEPPEQVDRWPAEALAELGLEPQPAGDDDTVRILRQVSACPDRYPRRVGVPAKRPLF